MKYELTAFIISDTCESAINALESIIEEIRNTESKHNPNFYTAEDGFEVDFGMSPTKLERVYNLVDYWKNITRRDEIRLLIGRSKTRKPKRM